MKEEEITDEVIVALTQILLPQYESKEDVFKAMEIAQKVAYAISMEDSIWLIEKAMERLEEGEPTENNNI